MTALGRVFAQTKGQIGHKVAGSFVEMSGVAATATDLRVRAQVAPPFSLLLIVGNN